MILVVALLGILFVAGAAFLQTVTFQARVNRVDRDNRDDQAVVDAVQAVVCEQLKRGWLGENGIAYCPPRDREPAGVGTDVVDESRAVVTPVTGQPPEILLPTYGEAPGVHPILAENEPHDGQDQGLWLIMTDLNRVMADWAQRQWAAGEDQGWPIIRPRDSWVGAVDYPESNPPRYADLMDSDGDGVVDSVAASLDLSGAFLGSPLPRLIPPVQRSRVLDRLRASDVDVGALGSETLSIAVRVISHGGMVNVRYSPPTLINGVLNDLYGTDADEYFGTGFQTEPERYVAEAEERLLRRRNGMPSRNLPETPLQVDLDGRFVSPNRDLLVYAWGSDGRPGGTLDDHRWWPFNLASNTEISYYTSLFDPRPTVRDPPSHAHSAPYDRKHLITTVSHDDLLIRGVRFPVGHPLAGRDVMEWIKSADARNVSGITFFRDNYPDALPGGSLADEAAGMVGAAIDPRVGRLQLSIRYLEQFLSDRGVSIDNVTNLPPNDYNHFVGMIQDTFWLMLWNHPDLDGLDNNGDGDLYDPWDGASLAAASVTDDWERAWLAAALTANFIDFADADDVPTLVVGVDNNGQSIDVDQDTNFDIQAYGVERQPYITEVYTKVVDNGGNADPTSSVFAIELHNPYDVPLNLVDYELTELGSPVLPNGIPGPLNPLNFDSLAGAIIPANGYLVCKGYGVSPSGQTAAPFNLPTPDVGFTNDSIIALVRRVDGRPIVVDKMDLTNTANIRGAGNHLLGVLGDAVSIQRDTTPGLWRFVVPLATQLETDANSADADNIHTMELDNSTLAQTINPAIRPVQAEFANSGSLATAYPTTGSLLLMLRYAHQYHPIIANSQPFNHVGGLDSLAARHDQIDNGRMPVFDIGNLAASTIGTQPYHHKPPAAFPPELRGQPQGVEALPWGMLVFDYFTALPLDKPFEFNAVQGVIEPYVPTVEQSGLRVHGRININAAPWKVLASLPLKPWGQLPGPFQDKLRFSYRYWRDDPTARIPIGHEVAKAIAAYRDARQIPVNCSMVNPPPDCSFPYFDRVNPAPTEAYIAGMRQGKGFLSIGELLNVRHPGDIAQNNPPDPWARTDNGVTGRVDSNTGYPTEDYVEAIGLLVGLDEWVTTRSHVFTVYGTVRGPNMPTATSIADADAKAIRFEETLDRLPTFFDPNASPQRIGARYVGRYAESGAD